MVENLDAKLSKKIEQHGERSGPENEPKDRFDRYEIIEGRIKNVLLQIISAEYYKLPIKEKNDDFKISAEKFSKTKEGVAFAESVMEQFKKGLLADGEDMLVDYPTVLATVMKNPKIKGLIDPDATKTKKSVDNPELDKAIKNYQMEIIEIVKELMKDNKPFLHMLISERKAVENNDIVIAGGMRNQNFPADPRILRWFQDKLENRLKENDIKGMSVKIATEGEPICGSSVHVKRREALGALYQFIKIKVPTALLKDQHNNTVAAIAEIAKEFQEDFPDEQSLETYLEKNTTEEDRLRLEGILCKQANIYTENQIGNDEVALSQNLRLSLGITIGEEVEVLTESGESYDFRVVRAKKINGEMPRVPMFSDKAGIDVGHNVRVKKIKHN